MPVRQDRVPNSTAGCVLGARNSPEGDPATASKPLIKGDYSVSERDFATRNARISLLAGKYGGFGVHAAREIANRRSYGYTAGCVKSSGEPDDVDAGWQL
jgi:hypothetical protein